MGENTKLLRNRIKSVNNTLHLTKAMGLVASSKIRRASEAYSGSRDYSESLFEVLEALSASKDCERSIYFTNNSETEKIKLIVIAGDRGLAGGYNNNIFRMLRNFDNAQLVTIGKRACDRFSKETVSAESFSAKASYDLAKKLCSEYESKEFTTLGIVATRYVSMMKQEAYFERLLPLKKQSTPVRSSIIIEPNAEEIMQTVIIEYLAGVISRAVKESFLCEVVSRKTAMDSAGKNAKQMTDDLQLAYNRARQGAITQEITEIVAGSRA